MRRNVPQTNLYTDQHADNLGDNRTGAEERRQQRERADQRQSNQSQRMAGQRRESMGNPVSQTRSHNDADQCRDERHKWQNSFQDGIDGVTSGLEQNRNG